MVYTEKKFEENLCVFFLEIISGFFVFFFFKFDISELNGGVFGILECDIFKLNNIIMVGFHFGKIEQHFICNFFFLPVLDHRINIFLFEDINEFPKRRCFGNIDLNLIH